LQPGEDFTDFVEAVQTVGAAAQFAGSLRPAQQQHADERGLGAGKVEGLAEPVLVFGDAAIGAAGSAGQTMVFKAAQGQAHFFLVEVHDRFAVRALVAGVDEGVQRERIVVRSGDFLLNQGAENAGLGRT
jgi:hypothetical protein